MQRFGLTAASQINLCQLPTAIKWNAWCPSMIITIMNGNCSCRWCTLNKVPNQNYTPEAASHPYHQQKNPLEIDTIVQKPVTNFVALIYLYALVLSYPPIPPQPHPAL